MAQIFPRSTNTLARVSLFGAVFLVAGIGWAAWGVVRSPYMTAVGIPKTQPIPFSHKHHVGDVGIDCRYCHSSVEESAFAGIPPTKTCMNCHSVLFVDSQMLEPVRSSFRTGTPLTWIRVNRVADFVYFNHSIHVAKGVGCVTCHGRVDQMPLMWRQQSLYMEWCLECHRQPERFVRPREQVFSLDWQPPADQLALGRKLVDEYKINTRNLTNCSVCHR
jgi:hypothetical protein